LSRQCELLGISRTAYYYRPTGVSEGDLARMRILDEVFTRHPYYGARRLADELQERGLPACRAHVSRLMRVMGIEAIYPKPHLSLSDKEDRVFPYLLRGVRIERPNQVWSSDITYIRLRSGFCYLTAVMDWYSRFILSWELSLSLDSRFCLEAMRAALSYGEPEIFNSDQGCQYRSRDFQSVFEGTAVRLSMDGKGRAYDNIMIERLWRTVKYEEVFLKDYATLFDARDNLGEYLEFYNSGRRHSSLGRKTPSAVYWADRPRMSSAG
jgi:putative transposase